MSHDAPVNLRHHGGAETLRLEAKEEGEETQAKEELRPVLPDCLRQQLTVAKQTRQFGPLGNVGNRAEELRHRLLARGDHTTVVLACCAPGRAALCSAASSLQHQV